VNYFLFFASILISAMVRFVFQMLALALVAVHPRCQLSDVLLPKQTFTLTNPGQPPLPSRRK
jgi:hypothetical protein